MQFGINLLPGQKPNLSQERVLRRIKFLVGAILLAYTIFMAALFIFSIFVTNSEKKLKQEISQIETRVKGLQKKESLEITLKGRVEEIDKIFKAREEVRRAKASQEQLLSRVQNLVLPGVSLGEIDVEAGKVVFSGEAQNFQVLGDFLGQFEPISEWSVVRLESLARTSEGTYNFALKVQP